MICLSRSDLNIEKSGELKLTRINYNELIPVKNGTIDCNVYNGYHLTYLCNENMNWDHQYCTLTSGEEIKLNPR